MKYTFDMSTRRTLKTDHLNLGGKNKSGESIHINNLYLTRNGKPWIPIMGECHFSRINPSDWEREILKIKAGGVTVIATYLFWIYHEEIEGTFDFSENKDIRTFVSLCKKHGMEVVLRIGPWAHGESRNGGFPDWLLKKDFKIRCNSEEYLELVRRFYGEIARQVDGFLFKDGGNIPIIQIENELVDNAEHLAKLKEIAIDAGLIAPIYTVTGWNSIYGADIPTYEVMPVFGGYPEAPWTGHTKKLEPSPNYFFTQIRNDTAIGTDLISRVSDDDTHKCMDYDLYPFATCELGGGICVTYHRRPIINGMDVSAISHIKLACGNNMPGYYMYHGGTNEIGHLSTFNESKETGYPNDYPILSYDFQAPIGEFGLIRPQYGLFKLQHLFLNDFMQLFAPMDSYMPSVNITNHNDTSSLRYGMRSNGNSGFVFVSNYQRITDMSKIENVQFEAALENGSNIVFPEKGITVNSGVYFMLAFNLDMDGILLKYSTSQLLCKSESTYFFFEIDGIETEYVIDGENVLDVSAPYRNSEGRIIVSSISAGKHNSFNITKKDGSHINIITLTMDEALHLYKIDDKIIISQSDMYLSGNELTLYSLESNDLSYFLFDGERFELFGICTGVVKNSVGISELDKLDFTSEHMKELYIGGKRPTKQWEIDLSGIETSSYRQFLKINYVGDVAQIYVGDKLVADEYYYGKPWLVDTQRILENGKKAVLVVSPLDGNQDIYFETDNTSGAVLNSIDIVTEYSEQTIID